MKLPVLILGNLSKPGVAEKMDSLSRWLAERAEVLGAHSHAENPPDCAARAKLCVVLGGDGTLLAAGRNLAPLGVPLLGVNMGKLGFLAEYSIEEFQTHFEDIQSGAIQPTDRMMLSVHLWSCRERMGDRLAEVFTGLASNDVAIASGHPFRMIDLHVHQGSQHVARYCGDGLIVATPTGSTGYNLSAGGPILDPTLQAVVISPVAPHTLSLRPMVLLPDPPIHITAARVNEGTQLILDGQVPLGLCDGQTVEVRRAPQPLRILPLPGRSYFGTLAGKLHWGQSPHHKH
jgi:NAD+ kinase